MAGAAAESLRVRGAILPRALWRPLKGSGVEALALLAGAATWEAMAWLLKLPWFPPFSQIVGDLVGFVQSGVILVNLVSSLQALALGFGFSLVVGLVVGALMGRYRLVDEALDLWVDAMLLSPSMVFAPIFFAIFGLSDATRVAVIVNFALYVIIVNTRTAIRTVDPSLVEMARSLGASEGQILLRVLLPASLPLVFAGIRLGVGRAVDGMINGEMFIVFIGLGALAQKYGSQFDASKVFAVALVVLIVALVANWIVQLLEDRLTYWVN